MIPDLIPLITQKNIAFEAHESVGSYKGTSMENFKTDTHNGYIELQYFGPLSLDDVEVFQFRGAPPSGDFLIELKKRNIKIRDARRDPAVPWIEPIQ